MSVGSQPNEGNINQTLTQLAQAWRDLAVSTEQQWAYLNKLGLTGLEALGFGSTPNPANNGAVSDAQAILDDIDHLVIPAQVYRGTGTQASAFNFEDFLTHLWAGQ